MEEFKGFKPIEISDREKVHGFLESYQPESSELTFTNLFIWRAHYQFLWTTHQDWLVLISAKDPDNWVAFPPIGPAPRGEITGQILNWLRQDKGMTQPRLERADSRLVNEIKASDRFIIEPDRDQFDYVYNTRDLINLSGNRFHSKKNFVNRFRKNYSFNYAPLTPGDVNACLEVAEHWCRLRRCQEDINLMDEWNSIKEILARFQELKVKGGMLLIHDRVEAFSIGEMLNSQTAVIHIEKANPELPGIYAMINQQFCEHAWQDVPCINREQDLGQPGLRQAKLSYQPARQVEKFRVSLK